MFGFFKKKKKEEDELSFDPTDMRLHTMWNKMRAGFFFDYDGKSWEIMEAYEYDWGDFFFSYSYRITSGTEEYFLNLENDGELEISITRNIKLFHLGEDVEDRMLNEGRPPQTIMYEGRKYYRDAESPGFFRDIAKTPRDQSVEMISWDYYDETEEYVLGISQWGETDFEADAGFYIDDFEISNIIPAAQA
ncbi:MAG: DUF4178 domain-containing protein [Bernardetiaceae bacterium]|nr:DUF4178 domain-containing protein [Bernardetiaceae bacterium]